MSTHNIRFCGTVRKIICGDNHFSGAMHALAATIRCDMGVQFLVCHYLHDQSYQLALFWSNLHPQSAYLPNMDPNNLIPFLTMTYISQSNDFVFFL